MVLLLLHMFVHTLHAHDVPLLLTVKHQRLLMQTAFDLETVPLTTPIVTRSGIMPFGSSLSDIRSPPFRVDATSAFSVGHFPESTLTNTILLKFLLAEFRTLHIYKQQFLVFFVD